MAHLARARAPTIPMPLAPLDLAPCRRGGSLLGLLVVVAVVVAVVAVAVDHCGLGVGSAARRKTPYRKCDLVTRQATSNKQQRPSGLVAADGVRESPHPDPDTTHTRARLV
jgi:hypothetical protein